MARKKKGSKMSVVTSETGTGGPPSAQIIHDGSVYNYFDNGMMRGYLPAQPQIPKKSPTLEWSGTKMDWTTFCQMISFFRWTYQDTKGESQCRLAYHKEQQKWAVVVLPQRRSFSLTTEEIADHAGRAEALAILAQGYNLVGTAHHHCSAGAFQSGTDKKDEEGQDGVHFTFGHMDKEELDSHVRVTLGGLQYTSGLETWIELPAPPENLPKVVRDEWAKYWLKNPAQIAFPEEWKARIVAYVPPQPVTGFSGNRYPNQFGVVKTDWDCGGSGNLWDHNKLKHQVVLEENPDLPLIAQALASGCSKFTDLEDRYEALEDLLLPAWHQDTKGKNKTFTINREEEEKKATVTEVPKGLPTAAETDLEEEAAARLEMAELTAGYYDN